MKRAAALAAAMLCLAQPAIAAPVAPSDLPPPEEMAAAIQYAMPHLIKGTMTACGDTLAPEGFLNANADRLEAKFAAGAEAYWPQAKSVLLTFASKKEGRASNVDLMAQLPDEALQPLVGSIVSMLIAQEIKPKSCGDIERVVALFDPLPPENIGGLVAFAIEMFERDRARKAEADGAD